MRKERQNDALNKTAMLRLKVGIGRNRPAKILLGIWAVMCLLIIPNVYRSMAVQKEENISSSSTINSALSSWTSSSSSSSSLPPLPLREESGFEPPKEVRLSQESTKKVDIEKKAGQTTIEEVSSRSLGQGIAEQQQKPVRPKEVIPTNVTRTTVRIPDYKKEQKRRLNILLLYPDDWRHDTIGKENPIIQTPFLDSLAEDYGIRFRQNAVTSSICWISRATLFTGQWASRHEAHKLYCPHFAAGYRWKNTTWPGILRQNGYYTGHIGKWQYKNSNDGRFDQYRNIEGKHWILKFRGAVTAEDEAKEEAIKFLKNRPKHKPFAMTVAFYPPKPVGDSHEPGAQFQPKNSTRALYENITIPELYNMTHARSLLPKFLQMDKTAAVSRFRLRYGSQEHYQESMKNMYALITQVDQACKEIVDEVKKQGLLDETMIIFTADNGMFNGAHGLAGKWYPYQESIRVPLIIHDPRMPKSKRGTVNDDFTLNVDLAETILGAAGLPPHPDMQGRDMADLYLEDREDIRKERPWRDEFFYEYDTDGRYIPGSRALVRKKFKYIDWYDRGHEQLFDLEEDPFEFTDVKDRPENAKIVEEMRKRTTVLRVQAMGGLHAIRKGCPPVKMEELYRLYSMSSIDPHTLPKNTTTLANGTLSSPSSPLVAAPVETNVIETMPPVVTSAEPQLAGSNNTNEEAEPRSRAPYAYCFLIGGIHEDRIAYRGFLYNVLVATQLFNDFGSQADVVLFLQLSPDSNLTEIPNEDARLLDALNIRSILLPKPTMESFSDLMFEKFRVFDLLDYRRVIYLDSDTIPLMSMDYIFHLSDPLHTSTPTVLQPNIMRATQGEPANGGFFMAQPQPGAWKRIQTIIADQRSQGSNFNRRKGWGHDFQVTPDDNWHAIEKNGTNWRFYGAHVDQGLLYYVMRFVFQDSSHLLGARVETWSSRNGRPDGVSSTYHTPHVDENLLWANVEGSPLLTSNLCLEDGRSSLTTITTTTTTKTTITIPASPYCSPGYRDFFHFDGHSKPWQSEMSSMEFLKFTSMKEFDGRPRRNTVRTFWLWNLNRLNVRLEMGLNFTLWDTDILPHMKTSPLGYVPQ